ncbi:unnamed protein product, partial [Closterium sp. NIES-53]
DDGGGKAENRACYGWGARGSEGLEEAEVGGDDLWVGKDDVRTSQQEFAQAIRLEKLDMWQEVTGGIRPEERRVGGEEGSDSGRGGDAEVGGEEAAEGEEGGERGCTCFSWAIGGSWKVLFLHFCFVSLTLVPFFPNF